MSVEEDCEGCPVFEDGHRSEEMCSECDFYDKHGNIAFVKAIYEKFLT